MKTRWSDSILKLLAWHGFLVSVFIVAPMCLGLGSLDFIDWAVAMVTAVACVHLGLISLEYSLSGSLVPKRLNAVLFLSVPILYGVTLAALFEMGNGEWLIRASLLMCLSIYTSTRIVRSAFESQSDSRNHSEPGACGSFRKTSA